MTVFSGPTFESLELRGQVVLHFGVLLETLRMEGCELDVDSSEAAMLPDPDPSQTGGSWRLQKGVWCLRCARGRWLVMRRRRMDG